MTTKLKWFLLLISLIIPVIALSSGLPPLWNKNSTLSQLEAKKAVLTDKLDIWLDKLAKNEACPEEGILDNNYKLSYGKFCYQMDTFVGFVKSFRKKGLNLAPGAEDGEIGNLIGDNQIQDKLTRLIFEESLDNWVHWRTTVTKKIGMPPSGVIPKSNK